MTTPRSRSSRSPAGHPSHNRRRWKARLIAGAALLLSCYAAALLYESFAGDGYLGWLTYPLIDKPAAERAYDQLPVTAPTARRRKVTERLVASDPANPESWDAVAYADRIANGRLTADGAGALDHSYAVSFFNRKEAVWRVTFALENWNVLAPQTRHDALKEARVALADAKLSPLMRSRLGAIGDPAGRLAALLLLVAAPPPPAR